MGFLFFSIFSFFLKEKQSKKRILYISGVKKLEYIPDKKDIDKWLGREELERMQDEKQKQYYACGLINAINPMCKDDVEKTIKNINDLDIKKQYQYEIEYLKGNFEKSIEAFYNTDEKAKTKMNAATLSLVSAVAMNNYEKFDEILHFLINKLRNNEGKPAVELALISASITLFASDHVPKWFKNANFKNILSESKPLATYLYLKYLQEKKDYNGLLSACRVTIIFLENANTFTSFDIYFKLLMATAYYELGKIKNCKIAIKEAADLALPHGFIKPFADFLIYIGDNIEIVLDEYYPKIAPKVYEQAEFVCRNWIDFHNKFTKSNITTILTKREYRIARILAKGGTYKTAAEEMHLSISTVKKDVSEIYSKLYINSKAELKKVVL